ncbi:MAG: secretin and TonB N-terminal domain-containing protein [Candidatus Hydrothermae bacterium]|nr:secretin and TonB N-terminal domain-containing protein [Candidatus Hydrothermae bacterium]
MIVKSFILMALIGSGLYGQEIQGERLVSMDFENADIRTVLRAFADIGGVNIVATKGVQGTVTLKLRNLPWKQALKAVLEINGFSMIEEDNIIKVMTAAEMEDSKKAMKLETRIFSVKFAKAKKLESVISGMLSSRGSIKVESRTNSLIVTDIPMVMSRIEDILARIDNPTPQVLVKAKLVEVNYGALRELGIVWRAGNMEDVRTSTHTGAELSVPPPLFERRFLLRQAPVPGSARSGYLYPRGREQGKRPFRTKHTGRRQPGSDDPFGQKDPHSYQRLRRKPDHPVLRRCPQAHRHTTHKSRWQDRHGPSSGDKRHSWRGPGSGRTGNLIPGSTDQVDR